MFRPLLKCADRPLKTRTNRCRSQSDCLMRTTSAKTEKNPAARAAQVRKHAAWTHKCKHTETKLGRTMWACTRTGDRWPRKTHAKLVAVNFVKYHLTKWKLGCKITHGCAMKRRQCSAIFVRNLRRQTPLHRQNLRTSTLQRHKDCKEHEDAVNEEAISDTFSNTQRRVFRTLNKTRKKVWTPIT